MDTVESVRAEVAELEQSLKEAKARLRELKGSSSKAKDPRPCACSCGGMTNGGNFLPGHDARLRSRLLKSIDAGDAAALDTLLNDWPSLMHGATESELQARLGSETRRKEAQVEREAEAQIKRDEASTKVRPAPKPTSKGRMDVVEKQQGTRSPSVAKNGAALRLAKSRAA